MECYLCLECRNSQVIAPLTLTTNRGQVNSKQHRFPDAVSDEHPGEPSELNLNGGEEIIGRDNGQERSKVNERNHPTDTRNSKSRINTKRITTRHMKPDF